VHAEVSLPSELVIKRTHDPMKGNALSHCLQGTAAATPARAIKAVTASMPDGPNVVALDEGMFTRQLPGSVSNYLKLPFGLSFRHGEQQRVGGCGRWAVAANLRSAPGACGV